MIRTMEAFKNGRERLISKFVAGGVREAFRQEYTETADRYFRAGLEESEPAHRLFRNRRSFAVVAAGGYGRKELCLHSDLDVMILFDVRIPAEAKPLSEGLFLPLWDMGLDLGYAVRTIKDCERLSRDDFQVLTSLMDARFVCGDSRLFLDFWDRLQKKVVAKKAKSFVRWLQDQDGIRMESKGDASSLLEPHLKEGIGGLRDYHHMLWLAKAFHGLRDPRDLEYLGAVSHSEYAELMEHLELIWLARNQLHYLSGRRRDKLGFEHQPTIAERLGFMDGEGQMGVERFMGSLHASMASIKGLHRSFLAAHVPKRHVSGKGAEESFLGKGLRQAGGELIFDSATAILNDPLLLIKGFRYGALEGRRLSMEGQRLVREFLYLVDEGFRSSEEAVRTFLDILRAEHAPQALEQMFETGFLDVFVPEFEKIKNRVNFDAYHTFPVGRHLIETVRNLKGLNRKSDWLLLDMISEIDDPAPLLVAALFHDIGKDGKDHAVRGAGIVRGILERLGWSAEQVESVVFLVRWHLLLVETATRRDLNDEKVVVQTAEIVSDVGRLKMLYLLTWADAKATGPRAWNDWIENLVQELFFKILHVLEQGELAGPEASQKLVRTKTEVGRLMRGRMNLPELESFFDVMSPRYLLNCPPGDIAQHIEEAKRFRGVPENAGFDTVSLRVREDASNRCWDLDVLARDRPGLFCDIAGVLALNDINVLSANVYTWRDGTAVDLFKVGSPPDPLRAVEQWDRVRKQLSRTFTGKLALNYRLDRKAAPSILKETLKPAQDSEPRVVVENNSSDFFTLIEVFAEDRVGLLYRITQTLFALRLDIRIAKIATKGDQIADVFYVRDLEGQKVVDPHQMKEIQKALYHSLARDNTL